MWNVWNDEYIELPIFSVKTEVHYHCPDGFVADNLDEAKVHGYGKGRSRSVSFGHGDAFVTFDYSILPVIEKLSMKLEKTYKTFWLTYYSNEEQVMRHEVWYSSRYIENGKLKPLVGTAEAPYNYIDQGVDVYIFEKDGYVCVLSAEDWESFSDKFTGFRVKAEEFYKVWNEMPFPEPNR